MGGGAVAQAVAVVAVTAVVALESGQSVGTVVGVFADCNDVPVAVAVVDTVVVVVVGVVVVELIDRCCCFYQLQLYQPRKVSYLSY